MANRQQKQKLLSELSSKTCRIYGIFDFEKKSLVYIHLDLEQVDMEFALSGYDKKRYDVVEFDIKLI